MCSLQNCVNTQTTAVRQNMFIRSMFCGTGVVCVLTVLHGAHLNGCSDTLVESQTPDSSSCISCMQQQGYIDLCIFIKPIGLPCHCTRMTQQCCSNDQQLRDDSNHSQVLSTRGLQVTAKLYSYSSLYISAWSKLSRQLLYIPP